MHTHTHTRTHKDEQGNCSLLNHFERLILDQGQLVYSILRSAALLLLPRHCCHLQKLLLGAPKLHSTPTLCPASPCGASSCGQLAKLPHNSRAWWIISSPRWRRGGNRQFAMLKPNPATPTVAHWVSHLSCSQLSPGKGDSRGTVGTKHAWTAAAASSTCGG